ncbi:hypothetical protein CDAR_179281 [Caerostris darwini]|uniref:Uncharacterized protein n=1 Tax=Caerostris darwini TaxID=1538125 RepID=A0AAV4PD24_9ARAC|nr:hypothetical protein CDAR_179281 [Caerostris darwini]
MTFTAVIVACESTLHPPRVDHELKEKWRNKNDDAREQTSLLPALQCTSSHWHEFRDSKVPFPKKKILLPFLSFSGHYPSSKRSCAIPSINFISRDVGVTPNVPGNEDNTNNSRAEIIRDGDRARPATELVSYKFDTQHPSNDFHSCHRGLRVNPPSTPRKPHELKENGDAREQTSLLTSNDEWCDPSL